ncbi:MAG TPA: hypothetical protein VMW82_01100 [Candidatus Paceibacterota bacterium]|nr:hypothetical protein [Candidatus Paceibacterota bacterium]
MNKIFSIIIISILLGIPSTIFAADSASDVRINKFELVWSADTYTPYNYQGRNLPIVGSKVIISPIISASGGDAKSLKYSWFLEDIFQQNKSGYGKDSFYFYVQQGPGAYHTVRLQIFNDDRTVFEEKSIQIPIAEPEIIFYSSNGNSHFSNQASTIYSVLADKTFSFVARPYFFSITKLTDLIFEWTFSGKKSIISSDYDASIFNLTISNKDSRQTTESNLWVNVKNTLDETQKAFKSMKINIY